MASFRVRSPVNDVLLLSGSAALVAVAYVASAARSVTRWDSGEFLAAVHSLGIPHPPGSAVYVLLARVWSMLPLPADFGFRVNLFSVVCAAAAVTIIGLLLRRWTGDAAAGAAAIVCAGGTYTLWLSATEAEVYAPALLVAVLLVAVADARALQLRRRLMLVAFLSGLGWALHPVSLLTLPGAGLLLVRSDPRRVERNRPLLSLAAAVRVVVVAALGVSAVLFLLVRAQHDPVINQGNPSTVEATWAVLTRAQYANPGLWPRQAPLWLQLGNWFEYADWQFAYGLTPAAPPSPQRTPITLLFASLGVIGSATHRRRDGRSWLALLVVLLASTVCLILYLNLKAGPSYGHGIIPDDALREARERDYFFITSFLLWGAWAGVGTVTVARWSLRLRGPDSRRTVLAAALLVASAPVLINFGILREQRAKASAEVRSAAIAILRSVPRDGVLLAIGDNDTYPLWYAQVVEGVRRDVTVVTLPLMAANWYREELRRRHGLLPETENGTSSTASAVCNAAAARGRRVVLTPYADADTLTSVCPGIRQVPVSLSH